MKIILTIVLTLIYSTYLLSEDRHGHGSLEEKNGHKHQGLEEENGHDHKSLEEENGHDHKILEEESGHDHKNLKEESKHDHEDKNEGSEHDHGHGGGKAIGKGKAISSVDEIKGFSLSKEAIQTLEIQFKSISNSRFKIAKKTLVSSRDFKGVYIYRDNFFLLHKVTIVKEYKKQFLIKIQDFKKLDRIVVSGVGLLRVTDIYSTDKSEYGHSH